MNLKMLCYIDDRNIVRHVGKREVVLAERDKQCIQMTAEGSGD